MAKKRGTGRDGAKSKRSDVLQRYHEWCARGPAEPLVLPKLRRADRLRLYAAHRANPNGGGVRFDKSDADSQDRRTLTLAFGSDVPWSKVSHHEHVLLRPETYVGSMERTTERTWVWRQGSRKQFSLEEVSVVPALLKIVDEILVNAADNAERSNVREIRVETARKYVRVSNDGAGITIRKHPDEGVWIPEMIFGHFFTGSNFDDTRAKYTGGRNGYGAKLTNIFSKRFAISLRTSGKVYHQVWEDNMVTITEPDTDTQDVADWPASGDCTSVQFWPDFRRFGVKQFDNDHLAVIHRRVHDLVGTARRDLNVILNGKRIAATDFRSYCDMYSHRPGHRQWTYQPFKRWQVSVSCAADEDGPSSVSFVNGLWTSRGGRHLSIVTDQVVKAVIAKLERKKIKAADLRPQRVRSQLCFIVSARVKNPTFEGQQKELLMTPCTVRNVGAKSDPPASFVDRIASFVGPMLMEKEVSKIEKDLCKHKPSDRPGRILNLPKLEDANLAGTDRGRECTLILTEGDSAKALVLSGISRKDRDVIGVYPLRGKVLNVREKGVRALSTNKELHAIQRVLGLEHRREYTHADRGSLRYGRVLIMTDQDVDGAHISGLLLNVFELFWPSLLKMGFVHRFHTPLVKALLHDDEGNVVESVPFYTQREADAFQKKARRTGKKYTIKYYKGLGTSDKHEAKEYFKSLSEHLVRFRYGADADAEAMGLAFDPTKADARKLWLTGHDPAAPPFDYRELVRTGLSVSGFVHNELIWFSVADCQRSLPSAIDGLKVSHRKALWVMFSTDPAKEVKVGQFSGIVSQKTAYHHSETSMEQTVVGMAQDFPGSNNVPLLLPKGQFGSRFAGGKDHAHPRYIYTRLSPIARAVFPEADDAAAGNRIEDGVPVEPVHFTPVIPMLLVNGSLGIGTGYACNVSPHNPLELARVVSELVKRVEARASKGAAPELTDDDREVAASLLPWTRGVWTSTEVTEDGQAIQYGVLEQLGFGNTATEWRIKELPARVWLDPYIERTLQKLLATRQVRSFANNSTVGSIDITVTLRAAATRVQAMKLLNLVVKQRPMNVNVLDDQGKILTLDGIWEVIKVWFPVRRRLYVERMRSMARELDDKAEWLRKVVGVFEAAIAGKVQWYQHPTQLRKQLVSQGLLAANDTDTFQKIMSMKLSALTETGAAQWKQALERSERKRRKLQRATPERLWIADIEEFAAKFTQLYVSPQRLESALGITADEAQLNREAALQVFLKPTARRGRQRRSYSTVAAGPPSRRALAAALPVRAAVRWLRVM